MRKKSLVSVVRCNSYKLKEVESAVRKSLEMLGVEIPKRKNVLIKPNIILPKEPEYSATTHPALVEAVCRILKEKQCRIIIGESDGTGLTELGFKRSGIEEVAKKYNAKLVAFEKDKKIRIKRKHNLIVKEAYLPETLIKADFVINLPKLKTHSLTKYTGAIKNMFGIIPGGTKALYHSLAPTEKRFSEVLIDVYNFRIPDLNIIDGIVGMEGMGPTQGTPKKSGLIIASTDGPALDLVASRIIGLEPERVYHIQKAFERKLSDKNNIEIVGEDGKVESLGRYYIKYKRAPEAGSLLSLLGRKAINAFAPRPILMREKCTACRVCYKHCPVDAISFKRGFPEINRKKCIRCFCCVELCIQKAMVVEKTTLLSIIKRLIGK
ncbi:MAG: DUF362 domain-containing protein [Candidatus Woesearchaeota archaeon]